MVLGEKLWEGKGKSAGSGFIKSIDMEGVTSVYTWTAQVKGVGRAKELDVNFNVTGMSTTRRHEIRFRRSLISLETVRLLIA
jgi:hypothetical protein